MNVEKNSWLLEPRKHEHHVHLEGSIPRYALAKLVSKYDGISESDALTVITNKFRYSSFDDFISAWFWKNNYIRSLEDFSFIAEAVASYFVDQNISHADIFFSPSVFEKLGLKIDSILESVHLGLNSNEALSFGIIVDLVRDEGAARGLEVFEAISDLKELSVVGIGVGGTEHSFPAKNFEKIFDRAKSRDFKISVHAGETLGSQSIADALNYLHPDRIGHGLSLLEDDKLIEKVLENDICIECCITSNFLLGNINSITSHPISQFRKLGVPFSINTDDPSMFSTDLVSEYGLLEKHYAFSREDIKALIKQGKNYSFCKI